MSKFPQRITATVTLEVFGEGLDWESAATAIRDVLNGNTGTHPSEISLKKVIGLESLDEEDR